MVAWKLHLILIIALITPIIAIDVGTAIGSYEHLLVKGDNIIHVYPGMSIQEAVERAIPNTTIIVHGGVYDETIEINRKTALSIVAYDPGNPPIITVEDNPALAIRDSEHIIIRDLVVMDPDNTYTINIDSSSSIVLKSMKINTIYKDSININNSNNIIISDSRLYGSINILDSTNITINNNLFVNNNPQKAIGIIMKGSLTNVTIENNDLAINSLIKMIGRVDKLTITNNTLRNSKTVLINIKAAIILVIKGNTSNILIRNNNLYYQYQDIDTGRTFVAIEINTNRYTLVGRITIINNTLIKLPHILKMFLNSPYTTVIVEDIKICNNYMKSLAAYMQSIMHVFKYNSAGQYILRNISIVGNTVYNPLTYCWSYSYPITGSAYAGVRGYVEGLVIYGNLFDDPTFMPQIILPGFTIVGLRVYSPTPIRYNYLGRLYINYIGNYFKRYYLYRKIYDRDGDGISETPIKYGSWLDPYPIIPRKPVDYKVKYIDRDTIRIDAGAGTYYYRFRNISYTIEAPAFRLYDPPLSGLPYIDLGRYSLNVKVFAYEDKGIRAVSKQYLEQLNIDLENGWINGSLEGSGTVYIYTDYYMPAEVYPGTNVWVYNTSNSIMEINTSGTYSIKLAEAVLNIYVSGSHIALEKHVISWSLRSTVNYSGYIAVEINGELVLNTSSTEGMMEWIPGEWGNYTVEIRPVSRFKYIGLEGRCLPVEIKPRPTEITISYNGSVATNMSLAVYTVETIVLGINVSDYKALPPLYGKLVVKINGEEYAETRQPGIQLRLEFNRSGVFVIEAVYTGGNVYGNSTAYIEIYVKPRPIQLRVLYNDVNIVNSTLTVYTLETINIKPILQAQIGVPKIGYMILYLNNTILYNITAPIESLEIPLEIDGAGKYIVHIRYRGLGVYADAYGYIIVRAVKRPIAIDIVENIFIPQVNYYMLKIKLRDNVTNTTLLKKVPVKITIQHPAKGLVNLGVFQTDNMITIAGKIDPIKTVIEVLDNPYYREMVIEDNTTLPDPETLYELLPAPEPPYTTLLLVMALVIVFSIGRKNKRINL